MAYASFGNASLGLNVTGEGLVNATRTVMDAKRAREQALKEQAANTMTYAAIGVGVLAVAGAAYYLLK